MKMGLFMIGIMGYMFVGGLMLPSEMEKPKWYGVTIDDISHLDCIVKSLRSLCHRPIVRLVFDRALGPVDYLEAAKAIHEVADLLGQPVDSSWMKDLSLEEYHARFKTFLESELSSYIDYWEAGNEINGDWTGEHPELKAADAAELIKEHSKKPVLTLYYTPTLLPFVFNSLTSIDKDSRYDVVLVSYYEEDNDNAKINWNHLMHVLEVVFQNAWLGIGEFGATRSEADKIDIIKRYYTMPIQNERYLMGGFYWYYKEDCVSILSPVQSKIWHFLNNSWANHH